METIDLNDEPVDPNVGTEVLRDALEDTQKVLTWGLQPLNAPISKATSREDTYLLPDSKIINLSTELLKMKLKIDFLYNDMHLYMIPFYLYQNVHFESKSRISRFLNKKYFHAKVYVIAHSNEYLSLLNKSIEIRGPSTHDINEIEDFYILKENEADTFTNLLAEISTFEYKLYLADISEIKYASRKLYYAPFMCGKISAISYVLNLISGEIII